MNALTISKSLEEIVDTDRTGPLATQMRGFDRAASASRRRRAEECRTLDANGNVHRPEGRL